MTKLQGEWWNKEEWAEIDYATGYYVSTKGRVYSSKRKKLIKVLVGHAGCATVDLMHNDDKKCHKHSLRKLVFETFFFEVPKGYTIVPVDGDKMNCVLDNLGLVNSGEFVNSFRE